VHLARDSLSFAKAIIVPDALAGDDLTQPPTDANGEQNQCSQYADSSKLPSLHEGPPNLEVQGISRVTCHMRPSDESTTRGARQSTNATQSAGFH
jgi:hypothetical protein